MYVEAFLAAQAALIALGCQREGVGQNGDIRATVAEHDERYECAGYLTVYLYDRVDGFLLGFASGMAAQAWYEALRDKALAEIEEGEGECT